MSNDTGDVEVEGIGLATQAVHAGTRRRQPWATVTVPIAQTSTFVFQNTAELVAHMRGETQRMEYGRYGNPTQAAAERKLAALDQAQAALLFSSGMAALTTTLLTLLRSGQHAILTDDCYRRTRQFCRQVLGKLGVEVDVIATDDLAALSHAMRPTTRVVLTESPTNPYLNVVDIPAMAQRTKGHPAKLIVDATFATPINQQPLTLGADLVVHSGTKYLAGHNDILCGSLAGKVPLIDGVREMQAMLGAVIDPHAAWLLIRGLKTLPLRVAQQNATAQRLAQTLDGHPKVRRVYYPGLSSHPSHAIARAQMRGFGGVLSFELDADLQATSRFIDRVPIFQIGPSLGGTESLIEQVALMSYFELTTEQRQALGISDSLVRVAVGVEDADDLERALLQALEGD